MSSEILFISDLHLDQGRPEISAQFVNFLKTRADEARVLYILGDLFEVWLGDDDPAEQFAEVFAALQGFSQSRPCYFMHGNRDFLIGSQLARKLGFEILDDPNVIELANYRVGLMHGDLLCTDDVDYQNFRRMVRSPDWQQQLLAKSLNERKAIAAQLREESGAAMSGKSNQIMDVNQQTVAQTFDQLNIDILIHGHTHRPAVHELDNNRQRIVLGDWNPGPSYLSLRGENFSLVDPRV
ncbi:MAG: UDP-2,3-diacylglucosamine diphosphatase [Gammaproteobacteria bacterium]|nr:UDP-2,3-diacylglucosamine diphosphatase [Gammaproteobacteria bacterium]